MSTGRHAPPGQVIFAVFFVILLAWWLTSSWPNRRQPSTAISTQLNMRQIAIAILAYQQDQNLWPAESSWQHDIAMYLKGNPPNDDWGQPIHYQVDDLGPILLSAGANKQYESGTGDDLAMRVTDLPGNPMR